ncbi:MAG: hydrolase [Ruminococcus sp.]|nr:hydrolase [Ruminococcus sp.]
MNAKEEFIQIYQEKIQRPGSQRLLEYLSSDASDFFTAPSSTRFHGAYEGGLVQHSVNVYHCLVDYLNRPRTKELYRMEYSEESVALVSLLHDICKLNFYVVDYRNAKNEKGVWEKVPYYKIEDNLPYGHGEKSVYIISSYMRLSREEAFAIRYHMGFSNAANSEQINNVGRAFEMFPLALALNVADMEASYFLEGSINNNK